MADEPQPSPPQTVPPGSDAEGLSKRGANAPLGPFDALALAVLVVAGVLWTQRAWGHPQIDFGLELYLPWQMVEGRALYAELFYKNGPLSPLLNAGLFRIFGVSTETLVFANAFVLACFTWLMARFCQRVFSPSAARLIAISFLLLFGVAQIVQLPNYNWLSPYQHSQTLGTALGLIALYAWTVAFERSTPRRALLAAGLASGAAFLTKAELFVPVAGLAAVACALWLRAAQERRALGAFALGACLPIALAWLLLAYQSGAGWATHGVLGNWSYTGTATDDAFYRAGLGFDDPGGNALLMLASAGAWLAIAAVLRGGAALAQRSGALLAALAVAIALGVRWLPWQGEFGGEAQTLLARGLPLIAGVTSLAAGALAWRQRSRQPREVGLALLAVWAFGMLLKMLLNARLHQYGFTLAVPATVLLLGLLVDRLGRWRTTSAQARASLVLAAAFALGFALNHARQTHRLLGLQTHPLGSGSDRIASFDAQRDPVIPSLENALRVLAEAPPEETLLVVPEGAGLNYWTRRTNPSRFSLFLPTEFDSVGGADAMVQDLEQNPPDWIVFLPRNFAEWELGDFGREERTGRALAAWIKANYAIVDRSDPLSTLLRRKQLEPSEATASPR